MSRSKHRNVTLRSIDETKYVTLEEFMERTSFMDEMNMNCDEFEKLVADAVDEIAEIDMEYKKKAIESIKRIGKVHFVEEIEGEHKIGFINDHDRIIHVSYLRDNLGGYIELSFMTEEIKNLKNATSYLSRWFVNGRYEICGNTLRLFSICPILDTPSLKKLISHALMEIWDMNNVATSDSVNK